MFSFLSILLAILGIATSQPSEPVSPVSTKSIQLQSKLNNDLSFSFVKLDPSQISKLRFFYTDTSGQKYGTISNLTQSLKAQGKNLLFATNAGIFSQNYEPLGLYIQDGITYSKLITTTQGYGNFHLQPNGVFGIDSTGTPFIHTTSDYQTQNLKPAYALQSGPMLLIDGQVNPAFTPGSDNLHIRSAVGTSPDGSVYFVITNQLTSFHDTASFFQSLGCTNALYLDGSISEFYVPGQRDNPVGKFAAIVGLVD